MTAYTDPALDLAERWRPTDTQIERADAILKTYNLRGASGQPPVYTVHLLVRKRFGVWNRDVGVIALDGVFTDRLSAWQWCKTAAELYFRASGGETALTGGYTIHSAPGQWAVFEDIGCRFGQPE